MAYSWWEPGTITTLDLQTGATIDQPCTTVYSIWPTRIDWSPTGDAIAVGCDQTLTIFEASGTSAPGTFLMAEEPLAFSWTDGSKLVVASGGGNIYNVDPSGTSTIVGRFEDPSIEIVSGTGMFSPDGRWLAYHGGERGDVPGNDFTEVGYLVPTLRDTDADPWRARRHDDLVGATVVRSFTSPAARMAWWLSGSRPRRSNGHDRDDRQPPTVPAALPAGHLARPVTGRDLVPGRRSAAPGTANEGALPS